MLGDDRPKVKAAMPGFDRWRGYLHLDSYRTPAFLRCVEATRAVRDFRHANGSRGADGEDTNIAVRVAADTFANQIQSAAGPEHDPATIAWVVAGLRCKQTPFCTGCAACQTITCPTRPLVERSARW